MTILWVQAEILAPHCLVFVVQELLIRPPRADDELRRDFQEPIQNSGALVVRG